ncbi:hypothetical protein UFOVP59_77 [uncultured Caudovirales phage]|uniref:Head-tail joining protein n=1 Tax=uncultured Caudovirales phage TaxID=2100421 RepID=A0A6J5KRN2_9CAUD|nr:hypothetical protein UFOVP59_77 [uncultured Caudovirales phage]CAB5220788.1 hypothetical protein UFOVP246_38 [uncultured Caudovirales phage]
MAFDQTSIRLFLKEHGKALILRKRSAGEYDLTTGTIGHTTTDYSVNGYSMNNSPFEITPESIVVATRRVILSSKQTDGTDLPPPEINDQVVDGEDVFDVLRVYDSKTHETPICYTLVCRG